jgi:hypothetical protein
MATTSIILQIGTACLYFTPIAICLRESAADIPYGLGSDRRSELIPAYPIYRILGRYFYQMVSFAYTQPDKHWTITRYISKTKLNCRQDLKIMILQTRSNCACLSHQGYARKALENLGQAITVILEYTIREILTKWKEERPRIVCGRSP